MVLFVFRVELLLNVIMLLCWFCLKFCILSVMFLLVGLFLMLLNKVMFNLFCLYSCSSLLIMGSVVKLGFVINNGVFIFRCIYFVVIVFV